MRSKLLHVAGTFQFFATYRRISFEHIRNPYNDTPICIYHANRASNAGVFDGQFFLYDNQCKELDTSPIRLLYVQQNRTRSDV